jgi:hypothetical protein
MLSLYVEGLPLPEMREGRNTVMLMLVRLPDLKVLEHAFVSSSLTEDSWRALFRDMYITRFVNTQKDVINAAHVLHKSGDFKGRGEWHRILMKIDALYPHMDEESQATQRGKVERAVKLREKTEREAQAAEARKKRGATKKKSVAKKSARKKNKKAGGTK